MKKLLFFLILITNYSYGQEMNNEPQDLLEIYLKSRNISIGEYVKEHDIKALYVLINNSDGYSKIDFDTKGNLISYFLKYGKPISKKELKYDNQNRISEIRYFDHSNTFFQGIFNEYKNDSIFTYAIKDSILTEMNVKDKYRTINIIYDKNENEGISLDEYFDENEKIIKQILIQSGEKRIKEYEYVDNSKFVTIKKIDSIDQKINTEKYLTEKKIPSENKIEFFKKNIKKPYKIESYDNNKLISELYFGVKGNKYKEIIYKYTGKGVLRGMKLLNYKKDSKTTYKFKTSSKGWLTDIGKKTKGKSFSYNFKILPNKGLIKLKTVGNNQ